MFRTRKSLGETNLIVKQPQKQQQQQPKSPPPALGQFMIATLITVGFNGFDRPSPWLSFTPLSPTPPLSTALYLQHHLVPPLYKPTNYQLQPFARLYISRGYTQRRQHTTWIVDLDSRQRGGGGEEGRWQSTYTCGYCVCLLSINWPLTLLDSKSQRVVQLQVEGRDGGRGPGCRRSPSECAINCFLGANFRKMVG